MADEAKTWLESIGEEVKKRPTIQQGAILYPTKNDDGKIDSGVIPIIKTGSLPNIPSGKLPNIPIGKIPTSTSYTSSSNSTVATSSAVRNAYYSNNHSHSQYENNMKQKHITDTDSDNSISNLFGWQSWFDITLSSNSYVYFKKNIDQYVDMSAFDYDNADFRMYPQIGKSWVKVCRLGNATELMVAVRVWALGYAFEFELTSHASSDIVYCSMLMYT